MYDTPLTLWELFLGHVSPEMLILVLAFGVVSAGFGLILIFIGMDMKRHGATAVATVVARRQERDRDGDVRYLLSVAFTDPAGQLQRREISCGQQQFAHLEEGASCDISYSTSNRRSQTVLTAGPRSRAPYRRYLAFGCMMAPLPLGIAVGLALGVQGALQAQAAQGAQRQLAEVTGLSPTNTKVDGRVLYRLEWRDREGTPGLSRRHDLTAFDGLAEPGTEIGIFAHDGRTFWEGDLMR